MVTLVEDSLPSPDLKFNDSTKLKGDPDAGSTREFPGLTKLNT
jgi:hypothetical protein